MEIKKRIEVAAFYGTQQIAFLKKQAGNINIPFEVLKFSDGSLRVTLDKDVLASLDNPQFVNITAYIESMDDVMVVAQIKDVIDRHLRFHQVYLTVTSPIYSRYDRVMLGNDGFGAKVFADFINSIGFACVHYYDCHSDVLVDLTKASTNIEQTLLVREMVEDSHLSIAPDKGACKKNPTAKLMFSKMRDLVTGKIQGVAIAVYNDLKKDVTYTVVDDLCEGGRTFVEVALAFSEYYDNNLNLYVTHGLFTNGAFGKLLSYYKHIYVYFLKESVYNTLTDAQKECVTVKYLIKEDEA